MADILAVVGTVMLLAANPLRTVVIIENAANAALTITEPVRRTIQPGALPTIIRGDKAREEFTGVWATLPIGQDLDGSAVITEHPEDAGDDQMERLIAVSEDIRDAVQGGGDAEVYTVVYGSKVQSSPEQPEYRMLLDRSEYTQEGQQIFAHSFDLTYDQMPEQSGPILACHVNSVTGNQANISVLFGALLRGGSDQRINISRYFETPRCLMDSHWHTTSRFNITLPDDMFEIEEGDVITYYETRGQDLVPDEVQPVFFIGFEVR